MTRPTPELSELNTDSWYSPRGEMGRFRPPTMEDPHVIAPGRVTPPERLDHDGAWHFSDLASACPVVEVDAEHRLDPYWDDLWFSGTTAAWFTTASTQRLERAGVRRDPKRSDVDPVQALSKFKAPRGWQTRLALLGALFGWRTMTSQQAATFVGHAALAKATGADAASAYAADLVDVGAFRNLPGRGTHQPNLYRLSSSSVFENDLKRYLTWPEWIAVTGGLPWEPPTTYDRHNLLATELGLRWAEYADIGTVLGERFSSHDLLVGSGLGQEPIRSPRAADLTVVRSDGMRIAIEVTAHHTPSLTRKVRSWVKLLHEHRFDTSGLCVVFVLAPRVDLLGHSKGSRARAQVYKAISAAAKEWPGVRGDRVAERIGVATWREWFPARGRVTDAFLGMRVDRPAGPDDEWEPCDMLDPTERPFTPTGSFNATAVLDNSASLGQTPRWIRQRHTPPELWRHLLDGVDLPELLSAKPPPRMLGLG